jgi:hypothetical protein
MELGHGGFPYHILCFSIKYLKLQAQIPTDDVGIKIENLEGNISFINVDFSYPTRKEYVSD